MNLKARLSPIAFSLFVLAAAASAAEGPTSALSSASSSSSSGRGDDDDALIEGTWILTVTPPGGAPSFRAVAAYAKGGVVVTTPDRLPPNLGNTLNDAIGAWRETGHRSFVSTQVEFRYGPMGNVIGSVKLRSAARITRYDTLEGVGQLQLCDGNLNNCSPTASDLAVVLGRRLVAEGPILP